MALPTGGLLEKIGGLPLVRSFGLNTLKASNLAGVTIDTSGNTVVPGTLGVTGVATFTVPPVFTGGSTIAYEVVTATNVITASESGKTFFLSALAGFESTLPTAAAGLNFTFIVATAPTSNGYTITGSPADKISGTVACSGAEDTVNGVTAALTDNVILVANVAILGDLVSFVSDGTNWFVNGNVNTFAAITANG